MGRPPATGASPVVLYVDRSGSMRGFLDPAYPARTSTDYRAVIDRLVVGLRPAEGYSFGTAVQPVEPSLATFARGDFYTDRNTDVEAVLARVAADTAGARTHIVVGDARRAAPDAALAQFVRMRNVADRWTRAGGSFLVGVSMAPFQTVAADPSGCRATAAAGTAQACPLYAFAFVAPGAGDPVVRALAAVFEHVYAWPARAPGADQFELELAGRPRGVMDVTPHWQRARTGGWIVRAGGPAPSTPWLPLRVRLRDSTAAGALAAAAVLRGQRVVARVRGRAFDAAAARAAWQPVGPNAVVRADTGTPPGVSVVTRGRDAPVGLYRVDLLPTGEPSWLDRFDAADANDRLRTYGLGRLFEAFRQRATAADPDSAAVARFFLVVN